MMKAKDLRSQFVGYPDKVNAGALRKEFRKEEE